MISSTATTLPLGLRVTSRATHSSTREGLSSVYDSLRSSLDVAYQQALAFLEGLPARSVASEKTYAELCELLDTPDCERPSDPASVIAELAAVADQGVVASAGGRYFGFVIGGSVPAAAAADWLTTIWDQNAMNATSSPFAAAVEAVAMKWLIELLHLPPHVSAGFVTGGQMANFTGLAAARHHVLSQVGWDVERRGLAGAPEVKVVVGGERHATIDRAVRYLGLGLDAIREVPVDRQGRMDAGALADLLDQIDGPTIVCAQAGNVNSGAFDPLDEICDVAARHNSWVHVDGAIGLWALASDEYRPLLRGYERADSWATDGHKLLNVPYDIGLIFCAHPDAHTASMRLRDLPYIARGTERSGSDWAPEMSRRARGVPIYAALRSLGCSGVADIVDRSCVLARRFADRLSAEEDIEVLNDVVFNQVLVRILDPGGDHDSRTRAVVTKIQQDGTCWMGGTVWQGRAAIRISVANWSTTTEDVDRSVDAIVRAAKADR